MTRGFATQPSRAATTKEAEQEAFPNTQECEDNINKALLEKYLMMKFCVARHHERTRVSVGPFKQRIKTKQQ